MEKQHIYIRESTSKSIVQQTLAMARIQEMQKSSYILDHRYGFNCSLSTPEQSCRGFRAAYPGRYPQRSAGENIDPNWLKSFYSFHRALDYFCMRLLITKIDQHKICAEKINHHMDIFDARGAKGTETTWKHPRFPWNDGINLGVSLPLDFEALEPLRRSSFSCRGPRPFWASVHCTPRRVWRWDAGPQEVVVFEI